MNQHTPGPWHPVPGTPIILTDKDGSLIASAAVKGMAVEEQRANATLIAAAPEMRALLAWIVAHCETPLADDPERLRAAVELLTKTGGVS